MASIEIHSWTTPTTVRHGSASEFRIDAGDAARFDTVNPAEPPVVVPPGDPGGGGTVLLVPHELQTLAVDELLKRARVDARHVRLGIADAALIDLRHLKPIADVAAQEGRTLVLDVGAESG